eukprot:TRINITY_DN93436_c0_g1_i1.p2 TRINITY_DN93436_c0_g1~~TRINITY_DN93436_c0_g1_i1.p2  ORF type:complete len:532 (-),score=223.31 TRINITY_DN93436_c0_g1_i1:102-1631(-)
MAPMKMKRARAASSGVSGRCHSVAMALKHADNLPEPVRALLSTTVAANLGCQKAHRHPHQATLVNMMSEGLSGYEDVLKKSVKDAEDKCAAGESDKAAREKAVEEAKAVVEKKHEDVEAKKKAIADMKGALEAAEKASSEAKSTEKALAQKLEGEAKSLANLQAFLEEWPKMKGEEPTEKAAAKKSLRPIKDSFDDHMVEYLPTAIAASEGARSTFEAFVMKSFEEELEAVVSSTKACIEKDQQAKPAADSAVESSTAALTSARENLETAKTELSDLQAMHKNSQNDLKTATQTLDSFESESKAKVAELESCKKKLEAFENGAKKAFAELEALTDETPGFVMKKIEGVTCDAGILALCEKAAGGGAISPETMKKIADFGELSQAARWAIRYALSEYTFTEAAHDAAVEIAKSLPDEPAEKKRKTKGYYVTLDGVKCDSGVVEACQFAVQGSGDGRVSVEDAKKVWGKVLDGGKKTMSESWTVRYCLSAFKWTEAAKTWLAEAMKKEAEK